ncbi:uncharacterized protein BX663DRAFT_507577 [Cokeromyces recurvatus]|uniref:uncharacterized protein n=1 Tax=Cokeromyces recurvatus TaxID=90255 RepID=UPI00221E8DF1|nr:uncharacterized protein BX663DRAFT_507577 [Cokeromyces recurvatus]KAI7903139.1 hypothetical protein BX663DRAFT_507577 [Cokeromyces recurvatus]
MFNLPTTTSTSSTSTTEPKLNIAAYSTTTRKEDDNNVSTLGLRPFSKKSTSDSNVSVPTTLHSNITDASQISYKTHFWELPDDARNELALLANFISEQTDKHEKIADELNSSFGPTLKDMHVRTLAMNADALILKEHLEVQSKALDELILKNKEQRLNAVSASNVHNQDAKSWRTRGAQENWHFYTNTIDSMEERVKQFSHTIDSIEEAIASFQDQDRFTPDGLGAVLDHQRKMYLSLAGRVAELHEETERIIKRRKLTK